MTSFDDRQKAQENKYAHEEELKFKARARGTKLFAQWLAQKTGTPVETYAAELVNLTTAGSSTDQLLKKAQADAAATGQDLSLDLLAEKYNRCLSEAREQVLKS